MAAFMHANSDSIAGLSIHAHRIISSFRIEHLRPASEFLGTDKDEMKPFSVPGTYGQATVRIQKNLSYFRINYLILTACIAVVTVLTSPLTLLCIGIICGSWYYGRHIILPYIRDPALSNQEIRIFGVLTTPKNVLIGMCGISILLAAVILRTILTWTLSLSAVTILAHASFRDPINTRDEVDSDYGDDVVEGVGMTTAGSKNV